MIGEFVDNFLNDINLFDTSVFLIFIYHIVQCFLKVFL